MLSRTLWRHAGAIWLVLTIVGSAKLAAVAGELTLKSGFRLEQGTVAKLPTLNINAPPLGTEDLAYTFWMLDDGMRRYFVGHRHVADKNFDVELAQQVKFDVPFRRQGGDAVGSVGPFLKVTPFNDAGHRDVTIMGKLKPLTYTQCLTQLRPQSCTVTTRGLDWEFSIATTSLRKDELQPLLRRCINLERAEDRFAVVRFYQQAGLYELAMEELDAIAQDLPDERSRVEEAALQARQLLARRLLQELKHRREAGQHRLTMAALAAFPTDKLGADILRELREFQNEFTAALEKIDHVKHLLGDLQAGLSKEQLAMVTPLRDEVTQHLDFETLPRLEPFLKLEKDQSLSAAEKLALAYSGWVVGEANAVTDLATAARWWQARFHVLEYLRATHPTQRQQALADLQATEGVGVKTVEQLIPRLPPISDTPGLTSSRIAKLTALDPNAVRDKAADDAAAPRYSVLVPQEFHPLHVYPLIIALHAGGASPEKELQWWGGDEASPLQSQRHGYIVIAPEYLPPKSSDRAAASAESIVWECLRDVRRRFLIDSDRVFVAGHGRGADAACEVALARPDLFAGVIPISGGVIAPPGAPPRDVRHLMKNAVPLTGNGLSDPTGKTVPAWYFVVGEFDFGLYGRHADWFERLMLNGCDVVVAQYKSRGHESFYSEIHRLFDWMSLHRRPAEPSDFELNSLRSSDVRLHWVRWADTAPTSRQVLPASGSTASKGPASVSLSAHITKGDTDKKTIRVGGRGAITIWLSPNLIDFDKRVIVEVGGRRKFNDFLKPEIEAVLEDFRLRGDRQRLHAVRLQIE